MQVITTISLFRPVQELTLVSADRFLLVFNCGDADIIQSTGSSLLRWVSNKRFEHDR